MKQYLKSSFIAIALTASMGASAALIKSPAEAVTVDAEGLDLQSDKGQAVLYSRLQRAAKQMCGTSSVNKTGSVRRALDNRTCYQEALTRAVESTGNKSLERLHKSS